MHAEKIWNIFEFIKKCARIIIKNVAVFYIISHVNPKLIKLFIFSVTEGEKGKNHKQQHLKWKLFKK